MGLGGIGRQALLQPLKPPGNRQGDRQATDQGRGGHGSGFLNNRVTLAAYAVDADGSAE